MGDLTSRIKMIVGAKADKLVSMFEDPVEVIDQAIIEAKKAYAQLKTSTQQVMAIEEKEVKKYEDLLKEVKEWQATAEGALKSGDEDAARKALEKRNSFTQRAEKQKEILAQAQANTEEQKAALRRAKDEIEDMESKADYLKSKHIVAKSKTAATKAADKFSTEGVTKAFDRMEEKINNEMAMADAAVKLDEEMGNSFDEGGLKEKYMHASSDVDADLEELKKQLGL
jgi:phage shock protein A